MNSDDKKLIFNGRLSLLSVSYVSGAFPDRIWFVSSSIFTDNLDGRSIQDALPGDYIIDTSKNRFEFIGFVDDSGSGQFNIQEKPWSDQLSEIAVPYTAPQLGITFMFRMTPYSQFVQHGRQALGLPEDLVSYLSQKANNMIDEEMGGTGPNSVQGRIPRLILGSSASLSPYNGQTGGIPGDRPNPISGDEWINPETGERFIYGEDFWQASPGFGYPVLTSTFTPPVPALQTRLFSMYEANRNMAAQISPDGSAYAFQPFLGGSRVALLSAHGNGTVLTAFNLTHTVIGTTATRAVATTNFFTSLRRLGLPTNGATAGLSGGTRHGQQQFWRGNAPGLGGFFYVCRFGPSSAATVATQRTFCGLYASAAAIGNVNPSSLTNIIGFGNDSADNSLTFMHNDAAGTATKDTLTGTFPAKSLSANMYEAIIYCKPNGNEVFYSLEDLNGGSYYQGSTTADLPTNSALLSPILWTNNGTTALAAAVDFCHIYIETNY